METVKRILSLRNGRRGCGFPAGTKEPLQEIATFGFQDAFDDVWPMVETGMFENGENRVSAAFGIGDAPDDEGNAGEYDGSCAHRAGFFGNVKDGVGETPIAEGG